MKTMIKKGLMVVFAGLFTMGILSAQAASMTTQVMPANGKGAKMMPKGKGHWRCYKVTRCFKGKKGKKVCRKSKVCRKAIRSKR